MAADGIAFRFDSVAYAADKERLLNSVLAMPSSATRARPGIRAGGGLEVTMTTGPDAANIAVGSGIITDTGAGAGSYIFVIPAAVAKTLTARPSAGQTRLDEVVARILNVDERVGDGAGNRFVQIDVIAGTPSAGTPAAPAIPAGQLRLAELTVPASGAILVAKPGQRIASLGGILPVADQAERDAISPIYDSLVVYREDLDLLELRANGAWGGLRTRRDVCEIRNTVNQSLAPSSSPEGLISFDTVVTDTNSMADLAAESIVIKKAGTYRVSGTISFAQGATPGTGYRSARLWLNGTRWKGRLEPANNIAGIPTQVTVEDTRTFAVNDVITLHHFHTYTGALNSSSDTDLYFHSLSVAQSSD